jgi:hypothetical protein
MINRFKKYILFIALVVISAQASAYQILQEIPALKGGIDEKKLAICMKSVKKRCDSTRLTVKNAACIQKVFTAKNDCAQSLALYQATQGVIQRWRQFDKITILNTSNASTFYIGDYFMLTPQGQLVGLIAMPWVTAQASSASRSESNLQIWPIALQVPIAYPSLTSGSNKIVFKQFLATSCKTCRPRGYVEIAYLFNKNGNYVKWTIQNHKITAR